MLHRLLPLLAISTVLAGTIPDLDKRESSLTTDFKLNLKLAEGVRLDLTAWPPLPKAQDLANKHLVSGPDEIELEGVKDVNKGYTFDYWVDWPEGTYRDQCKIWWDPNGPTEDPNAIIDIKPSNLYSNPVMSFNCGGIPGPIYLDELSGPYIRLEPISVEVEMIDPPMYPGRRFKNQEKAVFKGVSYMKRDNIKFRIYKDDRTWECNIGTIGGNSQTRDLYWALGDLLVVDDNGRMTLPPFEDQDNVGLGCKEI